ncbi:MAG TPA: hypothetical protein VGO84_18090 [Burkholderiales bacterium]|nr:hypothetical protein [Burkholderiales bacterium]
MESSMSSSMSRPTSVAVGGGALEAKSSAVSWAAILAGAFVAAALALILLLLGTGLGFSVASPWSNEGASAKTVGIAAIVWMIVTHLASSAMCGYLAGRLRTKWVDLHTEEVVFRDTAHGLASWAVGIVITAAFLTSAATSIVGGAAKVGATTAAATAGAGAAGAAAQQKTPDVNVPFVDSMLRSDRPRGPDDAAVREEAGRILASGLKQGDIPAADRTYLAQTVAARTGLSQPEAEKRVTDALAQAKAAEAQAREAADAARKAAAHMALWSFLALLIGAFTASYAAIVGGRHRDD